MTRKRRQPVGAGHGETRGEAVVRRELMLKKIPFEQEAQIGPYRVDFLIEHVKAVIEVDGFSHLTVLNRDRDLRKDEYLDRAGYIIFRLDDAKLRRNPRKCLADLFRHCKVFSGYLKE